LAEGGSPKVSKKDVSWNISVDKSVREKKPDFGRIVECGRITNVFRAASDMPVPPFFSFM